MPPPYAPSPSSATFTAFRTVPSPEVVLQRSVCDGRCSCSLRVLPRVSGQQRDVTVGENHLDLPPIALTLRPLYRVTILSG